MTGQGTLTPIAQYDSMEGCAVVEEAMKAVLGSASLDNARFKCLDAGTLVEMLARDGVGNS